MQFKFKLRLGADETDLIAGPMRIASFDLGDPVPREVVNISPGADGAIDTSSLVGQRAISMLVKMFPENGATLWEQYATLRKFTSVKSRPTLVFQMDDTAPEVQLTSLRHSGWSTQEFDQFHHLAVLQWVTDGGSAWESTALNTETILPGAEEGAPGIEFDVEFDPTVEFPAVAAPGAGEVANAGNFDAYPVLRLFGPFGDEGNAADETVVGNLTTGRTLTFAGTAIAAGDYLEIDTRAKTIRVNGLAAQSRQDRLVFPDSQWFTLVPGVNEVAFRPDTFSGNAQCLVLWRDSWL